MQTQCLRRAACHPGCTAQCHQAPRPNAEFRTSSPQSCCSVGLSSSPNYQTQQLSLAQACSTSVLKSSRKELVACSQSFLGEGTLQTGDWKQSDHVTTSLISPRFNFNGNVSCTEPALCAKLPQRPDFAPAQGQRRQGSFGGGRMQRDPLSSLFRHGAAWTADAAWLQEGQGSKRYGNTSKMSVPLLLRRRLLLPA